MAHRCAGRLKKKFDLRLGSQRHIHFVGFFDEPVQAHLPKESVNPAHCYNPCLIRKNCLSFPSACIYMCRHIYDWNFVDCDVVKQPIHLTSHTSSSDRLYICVPSHVQLDHRWLWRNTCTTNTQNHYLALTNQSVGRPCRPRYHIVIQKGSTRDTSTADGLSSRYSSMKWVVTKQLLLENRPWWRRGLRFPSVS